MSLGENGMGSESKVEVNLALSSGFFRITADNIVYNISVLGSTEGETTIPAMLPGQFTPQVDALSAIPGGAGEDIYGQYYKQVSTDIFQEIGQLAKNLSSTLSDLPAEDRKIQRANLDEAGEKIEDAKSQLRDIVSMTEKATMEIMDHVEQVQQQTNGVKDLLASLREHCSNVGEENVEEGEEATRDDVAEPLREKLSSALEMLPGLKDALDAATSPPPADEPVGPPVRRFTFSVATILQTLYEFCTNETVKSHITTARENVETYFDHGRFDDTINQKVSGMEPDADNFLNVPLSDILKALNTVCTEKQIQNLLQKMDVNKKDIFLDMILPLEAVVSEVVPPSAEEAAADSEEPVSGGEGQAAVGQLEALLSECLTIASALPVSSAAPPSSGIAGEEFEFVSNKIEEAYSSITQTYEDITKITEVLSFQDLSGQQILKIIKLLSDFQVQLLGIVVSFGSRLKSKERDASITPEESKKLAQNDVDKYLKSMAAQAESAGEPLDQDSVNQLLGELGF